MSYKEIKELVEIGKTVRIPDGYQEEYGTWLVDEVGRITTGLLGLFDENGFGIPEQFVVRQIVHGFYPLYLNVRIIVI